MSETLFLHLLNESPVLKEIGASAYAEVPPTRPTRFITIERTGGEQGRLFDRPTFAIQCWDETRAKAAQLASRTAQVLHDATSHPRVADLRVDALYNFPDPSSHTPRYQLTVNAVTTIN